jgi:hypothetical protein
MEAINLPIQLRLQATLSPQTLNKLLTLSPNCQVLLKLCTLEHSAPLGLHGLLYKRV